MKFTFETFRKTPSKLQTVQVGKTQLTLRKKELALLEKLAKHLSGMNQSELAFTVEPDDIQVNVPLGCGRLKDCWLKLVLKDDGQTSAFHFVARLASDDSLVYTSSARVPAT